MGQNEFFQEFTRSTEVKLQIFRAYLRAWLPTFLTKSYQGNVRQIFIGDFFAGTGCDETEKLGSPGIIFEEIKEYYKKNFDKAADVKIILYFNEYKKKRYEKLKQNLRAFSEDEIFQKINWKCYVENRKFKEIWQRFNKIRLSNVPCLCIFDQFGVKEISEEIFKELIDSKKLDFMFFISSNILKRFSRSDEIKGYFPNFDLASLSAVEQHNLHREVCRQFQEYAVKLDSKYSLIPFTIKKQANIYGIIFGTSSLRGSEKFLDVAWKLDESAGEADFNIDGNVCYRDQRSLFDEDNTPRKLQVFENGLLEFIVKKRPNNCEVYRFCLEQGISIKRSNEVLRGLQNQNKISVVKPDGNAARKGSFYLTWECYDSREIKAYFSKIKS